MTFYYSDLSGGYVAVIYLSHSYGMKTAPRSVHKVSKARVAEELGRELAREMGHGKVATTMKHYARDGREDG